MRSARTILFFMTVVYEAAKMSLRPMPWGPTLFFRSIDSIRGGCWRRIRTYAVVENTQRRCEYHPSIARKNKTHRNERLQTALSNLSTRRLLVAQSHLLADFGVGSNTVSHESIHLIRADVHEFETALCGELLHFRLCIKTCPKLSKPTPSFNRC